LAQTGSSNYEAVTGSKQNFFFIFLTFGRDTTKIQIQNSTHPNVQAAVKVAAVADDGKLKRHRSQLRDGSY
jgi:hypothetical protein